MAVRTLGCSGSIAANSRTTAFLIDEKLLIDAGTGVGDLSLEELAEIDDILLSHSHLDHITSIPLLADSVMRLRASAGSGPIRIHGLPQTLDALRRHIFNDVIWPDFTKLPSIQKPVLTLLPFALGDRLNLGTCVAEVLPAEHTVPAVGFAIWPQPADDAACWVFTGDTGPNPLLWKRLGELKVAQLVIETAFSDEDRAIAERSGHLHPASLERELRALSDGVEIYITHIKPGEHAAIMGAIARHELPRRVAALQTGQQMPLGRAADS